MVRVLKNLVLISLTLLAFVRSSAQIYQHSTSYGVDQPRGGFDSTLFFPTGCGTPTDTTWLFSQGFGGKGEKLRHFAIYGDSCGHLVYLWDPSAKSWSVIGSGSGADSAIAGINGIIVGISGTTRYVKSDTFFLATRGRLQKTIDSMKIVNDARYVASGTPFGLHILKDGQPGDTLLRVKNDSTLAQAAIRDSSSAGQYVRHRINPDSSWTLYNLPIVGNAGASKSISAGTLGSRPAASNCQCYYFSTTDSTWAYDNGTWIPVKGGSGGGGGGGGSSGFATVRDTITQTAHGFSVGNVLSKGTSAWVLADTISNYADGVVSKVIDANTFEVTEAGKMTWTSGLTVGAIAYSSTSAGALTNTSPVVSVPVGKAQTSGIFLVSIKRPVDFSGTSGGGLSPIANLSTLINVSGGSAVPTAGHYVTYIFQDFGGVADSSTVNTTALRNLRNIIAASPSKSGTIDFGYGDYIFDDSVIFAGLHIQLIGRGLSTTRISSITETPSKGPTTLFFTSATKNFLIFQQSTTNVGPIVDIRDISIINSTTATAGNGIVFNSGSNPANVIMLAKMERVAIKNFDTCLNFNGNNLTARDCQFQNPTHWAIKLGNPSNPDNGGYIFDNCNFVSGSTHTTSSGIYYQGGGYLQMSGCDWNSQENIVTAHEFVYGIKGTFENGGTSLVWIHHCSMENYQKTGIWMHNQAGSRVANILIDHNEFGPYNDALGSPAPYSAIDLTGFYNLTLDNNQGYSWTTATGPFMRIDSSQKVQIAPNVQLGWPAYDSIYNSTEVHVAVSTPVETNDSLVFNGGPGGPAPMKLYNLSTDNGNAELAFTPAGTGNLNSDVMLIPKGSGTPSLFLFGTNFAADKTNYHTLWQTYAPGSAAYDIKSVAAGTGSVQKMRLYTGTNTGQFVINTDGTISMSSLSTGGTAPTTSGTTKCAIVDANGMFSFATCGGGGGTPGGSDTYVQYNGSGAFTGSANFTWTNSTKNLFVDAGANTSSGLWLEGTGGHGIVINKSGSTVGGLLAVGSTGQYFLNSAVGDIVLPVFGSSVFHMGLGGVNSTMQIGSFGVKLSYLPVARTASYNLVKLSDSTVADVPFGAYNLLNIDTSNVPIGGIVGVPAAGNYFSNSNAGDMAFKPTTGSRLLLGGPGAISSSIALSGTDIFMDNLPSGAATDSIVTWNASTKKVGKAVMPSGGGSSFYQTVQSNTGSQTQRAKLNFGPQFTTLDNSSNGSTDVTVTGNDIDLVGRGAATSALTYTNNAVGSFTTYSVGGYLTVTAVSLDVIQLQVTWTDETNTSRTQVFYVPGLTTPGIAATGANGFAPIYIRSKQSTTITVSTVLTTSTGSITYDVGAVITQLSR